MSTQPKRTVTVFSTKGQRKAKIETDVTTWGPLKDLIAAEGYDVNSLLATENINRTDLANVGAVLPEGNFTVFLRPQKTKSGLDFGSMGFKELRSQLTEEDKELLSQNTGKNWTRCSKEDLINYLSSKSEEESDDGVEEVSQTSTNAIESVTVEDKIQLISKLLSEIKEECDDEEVDARCEIVSEEVQGLSEAIGDCQGESAEEIAAREAAEAEKAAKEAALKAEQEALDALNDEADELMDGF